MELVEDMGIARPKPQTILGELVRITPVEDESPLAWKQLGNCKGTDPEFFYPDPANKKAESRAVKACQNCRVADICLEFAINNRERFGVWGGSTQAERRRIFRRTKLS